MKNHRIITPLFVPAELRPEEFATYFSALAVWMGRDPVNLECVFQDFRADTNSEDSMSERMQFFSTLFFECTAGLDLLADLRAGRSQSPPPWPPSIT